MAGRLIAWLCLIWLAPLMYVLLRSETKFKKNIALGVTLPYEGRTDPATLRLLDGFKRRLGLVCGLLLALAVAGMLAPLSFGVSLTLSLVWTDLCIALPYIPYVACHRRLRQLKQARGWELGRIGTVTADTAAAAQPLEELPARHFVLPLLFSLIPVGAEGARGNWPAALLALGVGPLCVALLWALYRWGYRRRTELVDDNAELTNALTRLRRRHWQRTWLWTSWFMGGLALSVWLMTYHLIPGFVTMTLLTLGLLAAVLSIELQLRAAQQRLTEDSGRGFYVDTDDKWLWGLFYYDPNDRHLMVNDRVGGNTTVNLARRGGQVIVGLAALLLAAMPLMGLRVVAMEKAPVMLEVREELLVAAHYRTSYEIPLCDIERAQLLHERPAGLTRTAGTAMDTVLSGRWSSRDHGALRLCVDPREYPWLLVTTTAGEKYLLGAGNGTEIWAALSGAG